MVRGNFITAGVRLVVDAAAVQRQCYRESVYPKYIAQTLPLSDPRVVDQRPKD